jgi:tetratricopeptide (TPR) repeat protein
LSGDKLLVAVGRENLGAHHYLSGDLDSARAEVIKAIDLYRTTVSDLRAVLALRILSRVAIAIGDLVQASTTIAQARELAFEGHDRWAAECNTTLAAIHSLRGEWDDSEACYLQALREHERVGHAAGVAETLIGLGELHERRLDWPGAGSYYEQAVEVTNAIDHGPLRVAALRHIGAHMIRHADPAMGAACLRQALGMAESMPESLEYAPVLLAVAEMVGLQDVPAAMAYAQQAIAVGRTAELEAQAHIFMATIHAAAGRPEAASEHAQHALRIAEQLASPWLADQATSLLPDPSRTIGRAL